jgi:hypothetical protein
MRTIYAYSSEREVELGRDPHAVRIMIKDSDYNAFSRQRVAENQYLGRYQIGEYMTVYDYRHKRTYKLANAPCGLGCRCAAVAIQVCSECEREDGIMTGEGFCVTCYSILNGETGEDQQ